MVISASVLSCEKPDLADSNGSSQGEGETEKVGSMTITLEMVTRTKAYFKAYTQKTAPDLELGIYYSKNANEHIYECERVWDYDLEVGELCELEIEDLSPQTTYYYRPYLIANGVRELGEEHSFTTVDYYILAEATVYGIDVLFTGDAELDDEGGIIYSTNSQLTLDNCIGKISTHSGNYSYTLTNLSEKTTYYYCTYRKQDGNVIYGQVKNFTTSKDKYEEAEKDLSLTSATDLSASETANCYIVSTKGLYKIRTVKGNDKNQTLTTASSACIVWESFGTDVKPQKCDLISGVCYKNGYLIFETASTFKEGNAVIAVKDKSGKILWSWHIWMTDQPQKHVYKNNAGTMMDRNLGATSATKGDVGALGLLYQWGRKDPFLGSSSINEDVEAKSTITWPSEVDSNSSNGTIEYATAHPSTFISCPAYAYGGYSNYDWYYTGSSSTDNTRWTTSQKSIYDPCPSGWRVPDGGSNGIWSKAGFADTIYDGSGISFSISSPSTTWYPASGTRASSSPYNVGSGGYWSASPYSYYAYILYFDGYARVNPSSGGYRARGYSVRCLQESK